MSRIKVRPVRIEGDVAFVMLSKGFEAVIDAADATFVGQWNWSASLSGRSMYVESARLEGGKWGKVKLHRLLLSAPQGVCVDHIDGNGLNNRRSNLRLVSRAQNALNQRVRPDNTSGLKGVGWHKVTGKWAAQIQVNGKKEHLGLFTSAEEAHAAYCEASLRLHGEFGRTA